MHWTSAELRKDVTIVIVWADKSNVTVVRLRTESEEILDQLLCEKGTKTVIKKIKYSIKMCDHMRSNPRLWNGCTRMIHEFIEYRRVEKRISILEELYQ